MISSFEAEILEIFQESELENKSCDWVRLPCGALKVVGIGWDKIIL
jgi:hypothetical protein